MKQLIKKSTNRKEVNKEPDFSKNYYESFARIYFIRILKEIIKIGKLDKEKGSILDFGCGFGYLKKFLYKNKVVGYDRIKRFSEINDYKKLKPEVIVCNAVLQYLTKEEIEKTIDDFREMNPNTEIIIGMPTENILSRIGKKLCGLNHAHNGIKMHNKDIKELLSKKCYLLKRKKVFTMAEITVWKFI